MDLKFMRRGLLNLAICLTAFMLGTLAAIVFFTPETGPETNSDGAKPVLTEPADQSQEIKSQSRYPMIEIWQELDGSVPIRGKSLYFRLYDDGAVEFDYELRKRTYTDGTVEFEYEYRTEPITPPRRTRSVETTLERIPPTKISQEELSRLKSLRDDLGKSKNIKKEYQGVALTLDVLTKLTVLLKEGETTERKIIINDSDFDVMNSEFEKKFPKLLISLIKEIHLTRARLKENQQNRKNSQF